MISDKSTSRSVTRTDNETAIKITTACLARPDLPWKRRKYGLPGFQADLSETVRIAVSESCGLHLELIIMVPGPDYDNEREINWVHWYIPIEDPAGVALKQLLEKAVPIVIQDETKTSDEIISKVVGLLS